MHCLLEDCFGWITLSHLVLLQLHEEDKRGRRLSTILLSEKSQAQRGLGLATATEKLAMESDICCRSNAVPMLGTSEAPHGCHSHRRRALPCCFSWAERGMPSLTLWWASASASPPGPAWAASCPGKWRPSFEVQKARLLGFLPCSPPSLVTGWD